MTKNYRIYRPKASSEWQLSFKEENRFDPFLVFLVMAEELPEKKNDMPQYGWKDGITCKLEAVDLGEIISVLEGRKGSVGTKGSLFHKTEKGSKVISLAENDDGSYDFSVSFQNNEKQVRKLYHKISPSEASILLILLKKAIETIFGW